MAVNAVIINRFEQLKSSIPFNSHIDSASNMEESANKIKPIIDLINE